MLVSECLSKGLQLLEDEGWCQDTYFDPEGRRCMIRAFFDVLTSEHEYTSPEGKALHGGCMKALYAQTGGNVATWNDDPERTFGQVTEVYRRAIAEAELSELVVSA